MKPNELSQRIGNLSPQQRALLKQRLAGKGGVASGASVIRRRTAADPRMLSFNQQRLWFLDQLSPGTATYNVPFYCPVHGDLQVSALRQSVQALVARHEVLRTVFVPVKGRPVPILPKSWQVPFQEVDLRGRPDRREEADRLLRQEAAQPFDLARDVKLRILLLRMEEREHIFLHTSHHVAWDLKSKELFYQELIHNYGALAAGTSPAQPELPIQYGDYALWERRWLQGEVLQRLQDYWKQQLAGAPHQLDVPGDYPRPPVQSLRGAKVPVKLPRSLLDAVKGWSLKGGVTPFMTLLAAFNVFLFCRTGQEDLCVGSPVLGRDQPEVANLIGFFINTVVLRTQLTPRLTLRELTRRTKETTLGAVAHQALPFDKVVEALRPPRDLSRMPLFQVNFRVQGPPPAPMEVAGLTLGIPEFVDGGISKFDLALELPMSEAGCGFWEYSTDLFEEATIRRMGADFVDLLANLLAHPDMPLENVPAVRAIRSRGQGR